MFIIFNSFDPAGRGRGRMPRCRLRRSCRYVLGAGKYPDESYFDAMLNSNGGSSNAFTSEEVCANQNENHHPIALL